MLRTTISMRKIYRVCVRLWVGVNPELWDW